MLSKIRRNHILLFRIYHAGINTALTVLLCFHTIGIISIPLLDRVNGIFYDLRIESTLEERVDDRIVILNIDEKSLAAEGRWPWHRDKLGYLVDILFDYYQIKLLAFDMVFSEPDIDPGLMLLKRISANEMANNKKFKAIYEEHRSHHAYDELFSASLKKRAIVLGYFTHNDDKKTNVGTLPYALSESKYLPFTKSFYTAGGYVSNLPELTESAPNGGFFNNPMIDDDGVYRGLPLLLNYNNHLYTSFSLEIIRMLTAQPSLGYEINSGYIGAEDRQVLEAIHVDKYRIPVSANGKVLIPFLGRQGSFPYISITDVLNGQTDEKDLKDKIVLVGTTAAGLYDQRTTPVQNVYPSVEIHANIVSGILDQRIKSKPSYMVAAELLTLILISIIISLLFPKLTAIYAFITVLAITLIIVITNFIIWNKLNVDSNLATPLTLILLLYTDQQFFGFFFASRRKKYLGDIFGRYIPPEIVKEMSKEPELYSLKGQRKEMTVLFSDVRGFTTISEGMESTELCSLINEILTPITKVIQQHKGTIDKYIGDAVMAFWGAPIHHNNHAELAVQGAMDIITTIKNMEQSYLDKGWPIIKMGIGINTGLMTVGNMGSQFRLAYTVMGDAVNLGSRLEGLTKEYGVDIIVSESTKAAAESFVYRELDLVRVKGKQKPVMIYEPITQKENCPKDIFYETKRLQKGHNYYLQQAWLEAENIYQELAKKHPHVPLYSKYIERIREYKINPPPENWDGVYTFTSK